MRHRKMQIVALDIIFPFAGRTKLFVHTNLLIFYDGNLPFRANFDVEVPEGFWNLISYRDQNVEFIKNLCRYELTGLVN